MTTIDSPDTALLEGVDLIEARPCTRCDGTQHLTAHEQGMGSYRCDDCAMAVGFDLEASPAEFLLSRGVPGRYTQARFGNQVLAVERRLDTRA
ncbi:MAG TPA: hypothetical protein VGA36_00550 [Nitriliruptorales bacterium]